MIAILILIAYLLKNMMILILLIFKMVGIYLVFSNAVFLLSLIWVISLKVIKLIIIKRGLRTWCNIWLIFLKICRTTLRRIHKTFRMIKCISWVMQFCSLNWVLMKFIFISKYSLLLMRKEIIFYVRLQTFAYEILESILYSSAFNVQVLR